MNKAAVRVVWFVHRPDAACLRWSVLQARKAFPEGTTFHVFADQRPAGFDAQDIANLVAQGVSYKVTRWPRGGNLNGLPAVLGILRCMQSVAKSKDDVVWKMDADTLVGDASVLLDWFQDPNVTGAGLRCPWALGWWGISYALRAAVIAPLQVVIRKAGQAGLAQIGLLEAHEDMVISRTLAQKESPGRLRSWLTSRSGGAFCAHNYQTGADPRRALRKWGVVTFGNRWQVEGDEAHRRAIVAQTMGQASMAWGLESAREWRNPAAEALWQLGVPLQFGKSVVKEA